MLLSTLTSHLAGIYGDTEAIRIIKAAGFDAYDFSAFQMFQQADYALNGPQYREYAARLRAAADDCGIVCNQSHAPFASSVGEAVRDEEIFEAIVRAMETASILGAKIIVVHPKQHLQYETHIEELKEMNKAFYGRLIPYCEQFGIKVACENMWQYNRAAERIIDSTCSRPEEFCEYIDMMNSPWIVGCLDVGHVALTDADLPYFVRTMGKSRLQALHVHDNDLHRDTHTLPYTQSIAFEPFLNALSEIGYEGDFTFEADVFIQKFPPQLKREATAFTCKVGRYMMAQIQK